MFLKPQHLQISDQPGGMEICYLNLNLLTTTIVAPPNNANKWQMGFNSEFKGLISHLFTLSMHKTHILVHTSLYSCCEATLPVDPSEGSALYFSTTAKHVSSLTQV